ncbi:FeoA family protein [Citroniella saccharovorans]|uniref:FeoA family protein n=1 Tax=Citroniella saccharovorans TaxID=2053367 RepID=A0AAW9MZY1_9FIRM|nr:FeoA family protein [Citroniella saccharovorans]MEB3429950.1 FeoA family protein [Citroniella saccharovorans]
MKFLSELSVGSESEVIRLHGKGANKRKLMDMGITKGTKIKIERFAPLGDPIQLKLRNYSMSIRKKEAENIEVK